jgi:hypothetical protein
VGIGVGAGLAATGGGGGTIRGGAGGGDRAGAGGGGAMVPSIRGWPAQAASENANPASARTCPLRKACAGRSFAIMIGYMFPNRRVSTRGDDDRIL